MGFIMFMIVILLISFVIGYYWLLIVEFEKGNIKSKEEARKSLIPFWLVWKTIKEQYNNLED